MRNKLAFSGSICIALIFAAMIFMMACTATEQPPTENAQVAVDEWNIPLITVLTGPVAPYGLMSKWSAEYAAKEINNTGGIRGKPVKITAYDSAMEPNKATIVMTEVIAKKPLWILGPLESVSVGSSLHLAVEAGIPITCGLLDREEQLNYMPWATAEKADMVKCNYEGFSECVRLHPDIKSVVMVRQPWNIQGSLGVKDACEDLGIKIIEIIEIQSGDIDLGPVATRALALKPDAYFTALNTVDHINFCRALYERGMKEGWRISGSGQACGSELFDLGKGYLEDTYLFEYGDPSSTDPKFLAYVDAYKAANNGMFPYTWANWGYYEAIYAFKEAIEHKEITGDPTKLAEERLAIKDFLWNSTDLPSLFGGTWRYVDGEKKGDIRVLQIKDNEFVVVSTIATQ